MSAPHDDKPVRVAVQAKQRQHMLPRTDSQWLQRGRIPEAKERAERDLNRFAGVAGVRYVLAIVLHACALGNPEGSIDRATFVQRRDQQLDWLEQRAPETESLRRQWQQMRSVR